MTVEIPEALIERFRGLGRHFIRVNKHGKEPVDKGWTLNPMFADDPKLQAWLKEGGNYGVVGGFGLVIVDTDIEELKRIVTRTLPSTFTVESPGSKGWHLYFLCSLEKPIRLRDKEGENIGDIQGQGKMVVGPGSVHPNGGIYKVVDDRPLAQVTRAQLIETFKEFVVPDREIEKVEATARLEKRETKIDLDILQVVPLAGLHKRGQEYFGPHPVHGSTTKQNFWVNPSKNCWHCFRHGSGGGPLLWRAVEEGIIDCSEAGPGVLKGEVFKRVLEKAVERGYIEPTQVNVKNYETGTKIGSYRLKKRGKKVFLFNEAGEAVLSCNLDSVDGPRFKKKLEEITKLEETEINQATARFQFALQSIKRSREGGKENETPKQEEKFDEETESKARELVRDPAFFYKLGKVFEQGFVVSKLRKPRFIIGEERNKRLLGPLLIGASKLGMTSITKLLGDPATAKDTMLRMWLDLLPVKSVERSYFTAAGLRYSQQMKDADLLYIPDSPELRGEMGRQMRFMRADDGGLISEYATRDAETGEMVTKISKLSVKAVATTSNAITGDTALESGMWTLKTNGTEDLTKKVKEEKLRLRAGKRALFPEDELKVWRCAFKILLSEELPDALPEVPFAEQLIVLLESGRSESRRDPDKLCDLISLIAWVRRFQKNSDERDEADLTDLYLALQIGLDAITQTISELDEKEQRIFNAVKIGEDLKENVTCRYVANETKIPYKTCYRYLDKLIEKGFINKDKERGKNIYSLLSEGMPKTFLISEGRNIEKPDELMNYILSSFSGFSLSHEGRDIFLIDPLTAGKLRAEKYGENWLVALEFPDPEIKSYPYPDEKVRSVERNEIYPSEREKKVKTLLPSEKSKEKQISPEPKPTKSKSIDEMFPSKLESKKQILRELEEALRSTWQKGTTEEFIELVHQKSDLNIVEANTLVAKLIDEGKIAYDPEGWLKWTK
jgi:predicted transcriptional regulator